MVRVRRDSGSKVCVSAGEMSWIVQNLWLIPVLPVVAAGLTAVSAAEEARVCVLPRHWIDGSVFSAVAQLHSLMCWIDWQRRRKPRGRQFPLVPTGTTIGCSWDGCSIR